MNATALTPEQRGWVRSRRLPLWHRIVFRLRPGDIVTADAGGVATNRTVIEVIDADLVRLSTAPADRGGSTARREGWRKVSQASRFGRFADHLWLLGQPADRRGRRIGGHLMIRKLRWRVAALLNRLPWTCWPRIVTWALDGRKIHGEGPGLFANSSRSCREESLTHPDRECWCAKFRDGRGGDR